jgi:hypothetical protein
MQLNDRLVLTVNLVASTVVFAVAADIYLGPLLPTLNPATLFVPILLLHGLRHLGLMFIAPGAVHEGLPRAFAVPAAWGDLLAALLALLALPFVLRGSPLAKTMLWIFNVVGTVDLLFAIVQATRHRAAAFMGAAYWIPAFWVPTLLVTHYLVFVELVRGG